MSQCDHFIIANSTFSWWGAWLSTTQNESNKIVITPYPWFGKKGPDASDIYCKNWIKLSINETVNFSFQSLWDSLKTTLLLALTTGIAIGFITKSPTEKIVSLTFVISFLFLFIKTFAALL